MANRHSQHVSRVAEQVEGKCTLHICGTSFHGLSVVNFLTFLYVAPNQCQFLCLVGSQDVVLAEILHGLDNSVDADEDSVLGSQVPQELGNEAVDGSDNEDMQDLRQPLDGAVNSDAVDDLQRGSLNRYVVNM